MEKAGILIVEDEAIIGMGIQSKLQGLGYEVTSIFNNGADAIKKTEADKPDFILMDIRIKGDKDGINTAQSKDPTLLSIQMAFQYSPVQLNWYNPIRQQTSLYGVPKIRKLAEPEPAVHKTEKYAFS